MPVRLVLGTGQLVCPQPQMPKGFYIRRSSAGGHLDLRSSDLALMSCLSLLWDLFLNILCLLTQPGTGSRQVAAIWWRREDTALQGSV